jgi:hypothetical protein
MKRSIRLAVLGLAGMGLLALVGVASAAYTSLSLKVSYAGPGTTVISAAGSESEDATAAVSIYLPQGTVVKTGQPAGATLGTVSAQAVLASLAGARVPLSGKIVVAPPGAVTAKDQGACLQDASPSATWLLELSAAGQTLPVPVYVLMTAGAETALGPAKIVACLPPPDIPVEKGGAPNGAKIINATFTLTGVLSQVTQGAWLAFWTPWQAGTGQVNRAGTVVSPAAIAPGGVTVRAKKAGLGAVVSGTVTQGGQGRPATTVAIWGAKGKAALRRLGSVRTSATGTYSFRARTGDVFQARVTAASIPAPPLCVALAAQLAGLPCVNPTANGFTAKSGTVRRK